MKQLRVRILGFLTIILIIFSILFIYMASSIIERQAVTQQGNDLSVQLRTLESQLNTDDFTQETVEQISTQLEATADVVEERITLMDSDGEVLYDTHAPLDTIENHFDRPEIQQVNEGEAIGRFSRTSESTGDTLYYVATSIVNDDETLIGYLRLSKNIEDMSGMTDQLIQALLIFIVVAITVALVFTQYWTNKLTTPLNNIKTIADVLSYQDYNVRYYASSYKEVDDLGQSINNLAINLNNQMNEIKENELKLKELINHLVIGVLVVENDKSITMINPAMKNVLGAELYSKVGKAFYEGLHSSELIALIEKAMKTQTIQNKEIQLVYPTEKIVDVNVVPIISESLETINYIVLIYDITEIRRLEKVRSDFVANVSHELRTPITAVKGFSETLLDGALKDEEVLVEFLEIIYKESSRLDAMVNDILHLSKLEQRQVSDVREKVRVKEVAKEVIQILHQKIEAKHISVHLEDTDHAELYIDPGHLKQIFINLLANAVSYTPQDGEVSLSIERLENDVRITIEDTGIGIPQDQLNRIFERFYRVDRARSRNMGGTGLGLSIVKWIVENNNGRIEVESVENKGSIFRVILPISN
ncbi:MAG: PAS domain-containing protein [Alkalibacterium sp.]|nr:PAS domain-containing protein [Alkalibacterium sp.]